MIRLLLYALAILVSAYILPGVHVNHYGYALLVALVLTVANAIVKPILIILTIPITVVTLGLFLLVINAFIIQLVDFFVPGFEVDGFWWALAFSLILSVVNSFFTDITDSKKD
jgi:putative membrane protein